MSNKLQDKLIDTYAGIITQEQMYGLLDLINLNHEIHGFDLCKVYMLRDDFQDLELVRDRSWMSDQDKDLLNAYIHYLHEATPESFVYVIKALFMSGKNNYIQNISSVKNEVFGYLNKIKKSVIFKRVAPIEEIKPGRGRAVELSSPEIYELRRLAAESLKVTGSIKYSRIALDNGLTYQTVKSAIHGLKAYANL